MLAEPSERREDNRNTIVSFDYRACFILGNAIDSSTLEASLNSFGLAFGGSHATLSYEQGRTREQRAASRDWADFVADGNRPPPSALGKLEPEEFWLHFGFVTLPALRDGRAPIGGLIRAAWLEISDQNLYDMGLSLEDQNTNPLKFLVALFQALNAGAMALGVETSALQFLQFFCGQLPLPEVDAHISTAIAPPAASAEAMRQSRWLREVDVNGVHVLTRYLSGLEEYFPKTDTHQKG